MLKSLALRLALLLLALPLQAATLQKLDKAQSATQPQRVVVLEYSFIDALVAVGVAPIGIADDNFPERIVPGLRQHVGAYQSVGLRGQPNLEIIARLKPDLIIADISRHQAIYDDLQALAPTLLLSSLGADYETVLSVAAEIGVALGRESQMQARLRQHEQHMNRYAASISTKQRFLYASVSSRGFTMHGPNAFAAGVLSRLGINYALADNIEAAYLKAGFEQLAKANPDWLLLGIYQKQQGGAELLQRWQQNRLWPYLAAVAQKQVREVAPQVWSLNRGLYTAEQIATEVLELSQQ